MNRSVETSFYPERAKVNFERFFEKLEETDRSSLKNLNKRNIPLLSILFSGSQALTDMAMQEPAILFWALQPSVLYSTRFKAEMRRERDRMLRRIPNPKEALCRFKNRELIRIGWRDLLKWADTVETVEDLSRLADVTIEGALAVGDKNLMEKFGRPLHEDGSSGRLIVIGLGKLGGRELNFSSDIDIMYIHSNGAGETTGGVGSQGIERPRISVQEYYARLAQYITSTLTEIGAYGALYRVDLGLRPEGNRGPIVCSLDSAELYYESWGQPWERQMLIKARICAGSASLGDEFMNSVRPFVYRKNLDFSSLREIQHMKEKIDEHLKSGKNKFKNNVKLGKGGIREIEFIIQAYQLIYGGKMPWLAETNSFKALHRIYERGLLGDIQYAQLADALLFLRDLENRMQITYGRQVQILPEGDELQSLALKMNLPDAKFLMREYERVTSNVNSIFEEFFKEEAAVEGEVHGEFFVDLDNEDEALGKLREMKFANPASSLASLLHIRDGEPFNHPSTKSRRMFTRLLPELLRLVTSLPQKDRALNNLDRFFSARPQREGLYEVLLDYPPAREVLLNLFSYSQYLSDILISHANAVEIIGAGANSSSIHILKPVSEVKDTYDKTLDRLRRERNAESLRIGISYLMSHNNPFALMRQLSSLADEFLQAILKVVEDEVWQKEVGGEFPDADTVGLPKFAIIGLGKLGRRELNYGSDLDLLFVCSESGHIPNTIDKMSYYSNVCRKLLNAVGALSQHGLAYRVDARLRPEGNQGPIITTDVAAAAYYAKRGALWERMALSSARPVAGNLGFGKEFLAKLEPFIYGLGFTEDDDAGMTAMKQKIEREKIKNTRKVAIKYAPGGIVDIEFLTQKIKLEFASQNHHLMPMNTLEVLEAAKKENFNISDPGELINTYKLLRTIETHMRMETDRAVETLPENQDEIDALEEKLAPFIPVRESLVETVLDAMERVQKSLYVKP